MMSKSTGFLLKSCLIFAAMFFKIFTTPHRKNVACFLQICGGDSLFVCAVGTASLEAVPQRNKPKNRLALL